MMISARKFFIAVCLVSFASLNSQAATQSFGATVPSTETDWSDSVSIPQFNPVLGTLNSVTVTVTGAVDGVARYENPTPEPVSITLELGANIAVTMPDASIISVSPVSSTTLDVPGFDGTLDFGGQSGGVVEDLTDAASDGVQFADIPTLGLFTGTGSVSFPAVAEGDSSGGPSGVVTSFTTNAAVKVIVTYDFESSGACNGVIGNFIWEDLDGDGVQGAGETGIEGVTLTLAVPGGGTQTTFSDTSGMYGFTNLCTGSYTIAVDSATVPENYLPTIVGQGDPALDSNASPTTLDLADDDTVDNTVDFGFVPPCSGVIGDLVWLDLNGDGIQDPGELGIDGVQVTLKNESAEELASDTTKAGGAYRFPGLCAGTYTVEVDDSSLPPGFTQAPVGAGGDPAVDSNGSPATINLNGDHEADLTTDFGYVSPCSSSVGDFIWSDVNVNGLQDEGEPGIEGITVELLDQSSAVIATTTTGPDGGYGFPGFCAGIYTVRVDISTLSAGFEETLRTVGDDATIDSNGNNAEVALAEDDSTDDTIDIGFQSECTGLIGDLVWHDLNGNGIQDPDEPGLSGVTVQLKDDQGNLLQSATSSISDGADARYEFRGLCAATYQVEIDTSTLPVGFDLTVANAPGSTPENDSSTSPVDVTLDEDNTADETIDFGFVSTCNGSIGNLVWQDLNEDGIQDVDEPGIAGVEMSLRNPADNTVLATTTTGDSGEYQFTGLCAADYKVAANPPQGFKLTQTGQGDPATDSDPNPSQVSLQADDAVDETVDFGFIATGDICSRSKGWWKTHPSAWPVAELSLGGTIFPKEDLLAIMNAPTNGLASVKLAQWLITAKLNAANGFPQTEESEEAIAEGDALLGQSYVERTNTALGKQMLNAASALASYNNGDVDGCILFNPGPADPQPKLRGLPEEFGGPAEELSEEPADNSVAEPDSFTSGQGSTSNNGNGPNGNTGNGPDKPKDNGNNGNGPNGNSANGPDKPKDNGNNGKDKGNKGKGN